MYFRWEDMVSIIDLATATPKRRQIIGGILISFSLLFGGLAVTVITITEKEKKK